MAIAAPESSPSPQTTAPVAEPGIDLDWLAGEELKVKEMEVV